MGGAAIFIFAVIYKIFEYDKKRRYSNKRMRENDADPNCHIKSNAWYDAHPEAKGIGVANYYNKYGNN